MIQFDQSITASILRLCNSSYFGLRREIQTLNEALVLIGLNQIVEIILTKESVGLFSGPQAKELWRHSVGCALLSGIVSRRLNRKTTPIFFTAALLHDIGKVALIKAVPEYFEEVTNYMRENHLALTEAEKRSTALSTQSSEEGLRSHGTSLRQFWTLSNIITPLLLFLDIARLSNVSICATLSRPWPASGAERIGCLLRPMSRC